MNLIKVDENNIVIANHCRPELANEKQKAGAILVDSVPAIEPIEGKRGFLRYDPDTNTCVLEYVDAPVSTSAEIKSLKAEQESLKLMIAELGLSAGGDL